MYKDKEKQREANRQAKERFKAKQGIPEDEGIPEKGIPVEGIPQGIPDNLCPSVFSPDLKSEPLDFKLPDYVPAIIKAKYIRDTQEYRNVIDNLVNHSLIELQAQGVFIPTWRYFLNEDDHIDSVYINMTTPIDLETEVV